MIHRSTTTKIFYAATQVVKLSRHFTVRCCKIFIFLYPLLINIVMFMRG